MPESASLCNQLLVAMPGMADPNFSTSVTLICEHSEAGALGIVVNKPLLLTLGEIFKQMDLRAADAATSGHAVLDGGPVGADRGFVLHGPGHTYENSIEVCGDIYLTFSRDVIDKMAVGDGPERTLVALGYAGWGAGQLEDEMLANSWLSVAATPEIVFELPFDKRWAAAARTIGIDITQIAPDAGHA